MDIPGTDIHLRQLCDHILTACGFDFYNSAEKPPEIAGGLFRERRMQSRIQQDASLAGMPDEIGQRRIEAVILREILETGTLRVEMDISAHMNRSGMNGI